MSLLHKKSFSLYGHRTSIALEPEFWCVLENMARIASCSLALLISRLDTERPPEHGLASYLRVTALRHIAKEYDFHLPKTHAKISPQKITEKRV